MKVYHFVLAIATTAFGSCKENQKTITPSVPKNPSIEEITILESALEGINLTEDYLNSAIQDWHQVDEAQFYYESGNSKFPYLEGTFKADGMNTGEWRYYMKISIAIISSLMWIAQPVFAEAHLNEALSPLMTAAPAGVGMPVTSASMSELEKGVWIPNSYGGITAVQLDLDKVGSDNMLRVLHVASKSGELRPHSGEHYKLHSDVTIKDEKSKQTIRTVILLDGVLVLIALFVAALFGWTDDSSRFPQIVR